MQKCSVGKKIGMTQIFDEAGKFVPVTVVEAGPCVVGQKKTVENDGYESIQVGFGDIAQKKVSKPLQGHFAKADVACKRVLREFRLDDCSGVNVGEIIKADTFEVGDRVDACGTSKGKGYAGTIKRYHFSRLKETHAVSYTHLLFSSEQKINIFTNSCEETVTKRMFAILKKICYDEKKRRNRRSCLKGEHYEPAE